MIAAIYKRLLCCCGFDQCWYEAEECAECDGERELRYARCNFYDVGDIVAEGGTCWVVTDTQVSTLPEGAIVLRSPIFDGNCEQCCADQPIVCCLPDGTCDDSLTQDECLDAGGQTQVGFGIEDCGDVDCPTPNCNDCGSCPSSIVGTLELSFGMLIVSGSCDEVIAGPSIQSDCTLTRISPTSCQYEILGGPCVGSGAIPGCEGETSEYFWQFSALISCAVIDGVQTLCLGGHSISWIAQCATGPVPFCQWFECDFGSGAGDCSANGSTTDCAPGVCPPFLKIGQESGEGCSCPVSWSFGV